MKLCEPGYSLRNIGPGPKSWLLANARGQPVTALLLAQLMGTKQVQAFAKLVGKVLVWMGVP